MRRLIIGPCRSGTTMILRALKNHPRVIVDEFQSIKAGLRTCGRPDYSFFSKTCPPGKTLVAKETIGHSSHSDCTLHVYPDLRFAELVKATRPLFCFREPLNTYNSWLRNGLVPEPIEPALFIEAYRWTYAMYERARSVGSRIGVVIYEHACLRPEATLRALWGIPYDTRMLSWRDDFPDTPGLDQEGVEAGHYSRVAVTRTIERSVVTELDIPNDHLLEIESSGLEEMYQAVLKSSQGLASE